jgi:hypothetical protein
MTDPTSRQRGRPKNDKTVTLKKKNLWSKVRYLGSTPRHTDWLTDWLTVAMWLWLCLFTDTAYTLFAPLLRTQLIQSLPKAMRASGILKMDVFSGVMLYSPTELKKNSVAWVRERTIPTERPPHDGDVRANFLRIKIATWSAWRIPNGRIFGFLDRSLYFFFQAAPQL